MTSFRLHLAMRASTQMVTYDPKKDRSFTLYSIDHRKSCAAFSTYPCATVYQNTTTQSEPSACEGRVPVFDTERTLCKAFCLQFRRLASLVAVRVDANCICGERVGCLGLRGQLDLKTALDYVSHIAAFYVIQQRRVLSLAQATAKQWEVTSAVGRLY